MGTELFADLFLVHILKRRYLYSMVYLVMMRLILLYSYNLWFVPVADELICYMVDSSCMKGPRNSVASS